MNIDYTALQKTKEACHEELDMIVNKYNTHHLQTIYQYMKVEMKNQMIISVIGMLLITLVSYFMNDATTVCIMLYFLVLGSQAILEYMKNQIYGVKELLSVSYINEGRSFLYKSVGIAILQLGMFGFICILISFNQITFIKTIFYALLPVYISQMLSLQFMKFITNIFGVLMSYFMIYLSLIFVIDYLNIVSYISVSTCYIAIIVMVFIYIGNITFLYKEKKGRNLIWN